MASLSTQENIKILKPLELGFKRTINWKNIQLKEQIKHKTHNLDYPIDPSFQGVNRLFVLSFKNADGRESHKQFYLPTM